MGVNTADGVRARIERLLAGQSLPANAWEYAENLLRRFVTPVRVVILGLPGSGKTQILNMLVGRSLIVDGSSLPSTTITAGVSWRTRITRDDDTVQAVDGVVLDGPEICRARMLTLEAPLAILSRISLMEVAADASVEGLRRAVEYGASRAEILIWCTQEFCELERLLWRSVPSGLKDHSFLALTKADELQRAGVLSQRLASLTAVSAEEFCGVMPIATLRALAALDEGRVADEAAFVASGGRALRAAVLKHVEQGRRADIDNALLFLRRYETARGGGADPAAAANAPPDAPGRPSDASAASGERRGCLERALDHLRTRAEVLAELVPDASADKYATFLSACSETADSLNELLAGAGGASATSSLEESVSEASEMMLLLQLEKGLGPAADAATLLLQMRREIEDELAA